MRGRIRYWWALTVLVPLTIVLGLLVIALRLITFSDRLPARIGVLWARAILRTSGVEVSVSGLENIDPKAQYIFLGNHTSAFDIPAMYVGVPNQLGMLAKVGLAYIPVFGWAMWAAGHFFINRHDHAKAMSMMEQVTRILQRYRHRSLVIFPEGTRSLDGQLHPFKKGAFLMAIESGIPIVPVVINGAFKAKSKYAHAIEPTHIELVISKPIDPAKFSFETRNEFIAETYQVFESLYQAPSSDTQ